MTTEVRDLLLSTPSLRVSVSDTLAAALDAWHDHWASPASARPRVALQDHVEPGDAASEGPDWQPDVRTSHGVLWWAEQDDAATRVAAMLLGLGLPLGGSSGPDDWPLEVAEQALVDFKRRCVQALGLRHERDVGTAGVLYEAFSSVEASDWLRPYTGAMVVDLAGLGLKCLLTPQAYAALQGAPSAPPTQRPELVSLPALLVDRGVRLSLELGVIDVTIEDLMALRQGDVVRFPARLALPLTVRLQPVAAQAASPAGSAAATEVALAADLGQLGDRVAIQLAGSAKAPAPLSHLTARKTALS